MSRRNSMLLAGVVAIAAVAAYWMLALTPKREQAAKLSHSIAAKQADLKKSEAELASYEQARSGYKANYSLVARLGKAVPADDDVRSLLIQVNSAAGKSKVDFRTIAVRRHVVEIVYTTDEYIETLATYSPNIALDDERRRRLFDRIRARVERAGGAITKPYLFVVNLARRVM